MGWVDSKNYLDGSPVEKKNFGGVTAEQIRNFDDQMKKGTDQKIINDKATEQERKAADNELNKNLKETYNTTESNLRKEKTLTTPMEQFKQSMLKKYPDKMTGEQIDGSLMSNNELIKVKSILETPWLWEIVNDSKNAPYISEFLKAMPEDEQSLMKIMLNMMRTQEWENELKKLFDVTFVSSYHQLNGKLDENNLDTPDSQKAILNIFTRDKEWWYNNLLTSLTTENNPNKWLAENVVRKYVALQYADRWFTPSATISVEQSQDGQQLIVVTEWDKKLWFWFGKNGEPQKFSEVVNLQSPEAIKKLYNMNERGEIPINRDELKKQLQVVEQTIQWDKWLNSWNKITTPRKPLWFLDGFKTLFDSPLASEFKAIFYNMMALFGKEEDKNKYAIEAAFSEAEQKISKLDSGKSEEEKEKVIDKAWNKLTYIRALKLLTLWKNDENMQDLKRRFAWAWIDQQKAYIAAAIKDPTNTDLLNILWEKVDKPADTKETKENPNIIKVKGIDDINYPDGMPLEIRGSGDDQYIKMGSHLLVPIINNEIRFYKWIGWNLAGEKIITVTKNEKWDTILSPAKDWKNYPSRGDEILVDPTKDDLTKDDNKFNLWVSLMWLWLWRTDFINADKWKGELIVANFRKQLISMPKEQRTPTILREKLEKIKTDLLPYIPDDQKENFKKREINLALGQQRS